MSPSRIPRPSPVSISNRSAPNSPGPGSHNPGFKPNNPFAQSAHRAQSPSPGQPSPPTHTNSRIPANPGIQVRRRKPPSDLDSSPSPPQSHTPSHHPIGIGRRPVPTLEEVNGLTRNGNGNGSPLQNGRNVSNPQRSCLRQPSTPSLNANTKTQTQTRSRALSSPNSPQPPVPLPNATLLFEPSFAESREPSVPPHIRVRLRLIHQLGVVLGMDAQGISGKIDVPGLLARVDAAYDRGGTSVGLGKEGSVSGLPLPLVGGVGVAGGGIVGGQGMVGKGSKNGREGVLGMFKRFGRKGGDEPLGAGTRLTGGSGEGMSWCRNLTDLFRSGIWSGVE